MRLILTAASLLLVICSYGQKYELGINGGLSNTARVRESLYQGENGKWTYATGLNFHLNINEHLQAGLEAGMTRWERSTTWPLYSAGNQFLGTKDVSYILAERALTLAFRFNYVVPFYAQYEDFIKSSLYFGLTAGGVATGSEGKIEYSRANPNTPSEYAYVSKFQYQSGWGTLLGVQVGYTYYFSSAFGLNLEFAPKMAWVKTADSKYAYANDTYNILYFPTTIGLRVRFGEINY